MGSTEPIERGDGLEAAVPLHAPTAYWTSTDTKMATATTTPTTTTVEEAASTRTSFFSPQKRKRDNSSFEIPETPWRLQHPIPQQNDDDDDDEDEDEDEERARVELEVEDRDEPPMASGQVSPQSNKLASQLWDLDLSGKLANQSLLQQSGGDLEMATVTMAQEEEGLPTAKKVKRRGQSAIADGGKKTVVTEDADGVGNEVDELGTTAKRKEKLMLSFGEETPNGDEKRSVNGDVRRTRLRSPPLLKTKDSDASDNDGMMDGGDDVDSDDPEQVGIGYRPTPTQRYVRNQKRMQQIKEYKARISKEAREKRSETRRKRRSLPSQLTATSAEGTGSTEEGERRKVVHFNLEPVVVGVIPEDITTRFVIPEVSPVVQFPV